jgi:endonuclease YncB( thermonuclease family)
MTALGRFEPISSIAIRWSPRSDFAPATIANRKCRITTYEVPQSTRSEKWTKRTGSVHRSAKFDGQVKNCYVVEFTDNEPSPLNVDLGVAPESKQAFGQASKKNLSAMVFDREVMLDCGKTDKYRRQICVSHTQLAWAGWSGLTRTGRDSMACRQIAAT